MSGQNGSLSLRQSALRPVPGWRRWSAIGGDRPGHAVRVTVTPASLPSAAASGRPRPGRGPAAARAEEPPPARGPRQPQAPFQTDPHCQAPTVTVPPRPVRLVRRRRSGLGAGPSAGKDSRARLLGPAARAESRSGRSHESFPGTGRLGRAAG